MIRIQRNTIYIPRGDTGSISFPNNFPHHEGDIAFCSVFDRLTRKTILEKQIDGSSPYFTIFFDHEDTQTISVGTYYYDIKLYNHPRYDEEGTLIGANEINSMFGLYRLPKLIIMEVAQSNGNATANP